MDNTSCKHPEWAKDIQELPTEFDPAEDRYAIVPDEVSKTEGDFKFAENVKEGSSQVGTIIERGPGLESVYTHKKLGMQYDVGEKVAFGIHTGDDFLMAEDGDLTSFKYSGSVLAGYIMVKIIRQGGILTGVSLRNY